MKVTMDLDQEFMLALVLRTCGTLSVKVDFLVKSVVENGLHLVDYLNPPGEGGKIPRIREIKEEWGCDLTMAVELERRERAVEWLRTQRLEEDKGA